MAPARSDASLDIRLDRDADVPLGVQLTWALRARIESGALAAGERAPGLQRLAAEVGVNVNTVRAVYQRLEQEGLVTTRHGSGTFVTGARGDRRALAQLAAEAARAAREAGLDPRELAAALYAGPEVDAGTAPVGATRGTPSVGVGRPGVRVGTPQAAAGSAAAGIAPGDAPSPAAERRRLREQIGALERALSELTARQATPQAEPLSLAARGAEAAGPRLLDAAELAQRRDELLARLAAAQAAPSERRPVEPQGGAQ